MRLWRRRRARASDVEGDPLPLSPAFNSAITEYAIAVPNASAEANLGAWVTFAGASVQWLSASDTVLATTAVYAVNPLALGVTVLKVKVTAEDGTTTKTFTITRAAEEPTSPLIFNGWYTGAAFEVGIAFRKNHIYGSPVTGFELDDITVTNGTATNLVDQYGDGIVWFATVTPTDSTQPVTVGVAAGAATVVADGSLTEAGGTLTVLSYATGPVEGITISQDEGVYRANFVFRSTITGLECDEVEVSGATPEYMPYHNPRNCDIWLRPPYGQGDITITIAADAYEDGDSVANAAFSYTITRWSGPDRSTGSIAQTGIGHRPGQQKSPHT